MRSDAAHIESDSSIALASEVSAFRRFLQLAVTEVRRNPWLSRNSGYSAFEGGRVRRPKRPSQSGLGDQEVFGVLTSNNPQVTHEKKTRFHADFVQLQKTV